MSRYIFAALVWLSFATWGSTQESPSADTIRLREIAQGFHEAGQFDGAVLVGRGNEVLLRGGFGLASAEHGIAVGPDTCFRLASVTKQFTAAAVLLLCELDELDLHTPIATYLPELKPSIAEKVTLHHLLSHSAGIVRAVESLTTKDMGDHFTTDEIVFLLNGTEVEFPPGSRFSYSNAGYVLAATIVARTTGLPYGDAMRELVFEPLGLENTGHEMAGKLMPRRAIGYSRLLDGVANAPYEDKSYVTGAGSLYSTIDDLWIWARAILDDELLLASTREEMFQVQATGYGYGWFLETYAAKSTQGSTQHPGINHDGGCPGFSTKIALYPAHDLVIIILSNVLPSDVGGLNQQLANALLNLPVRLPQPPVGHALGLVALEEGIQPALERWDLLRTSTTNLGLMPGANTFSGYGFEYLAAHQPHKAMRLFELATGAFPRSPRAHRGLGQALRLLQRRDEACSAFERALELNPQSESVRQALEELRSPQH